MSQCPQCGTATTEGQPFCGACGATLAAQTPAPDPDEGKTQIREQRPPAQQTGQQPGQQQWAQQPAAPQQPQQPWGQQPPAPQQPQQPWGQQPPAPQQPQPGQHPQQPWGQQQPQGQYAAQGQQQYGAPQGQYAAPQGGGNGVNFDFTKLLVGNWAGMAMVAGAAFGIALVLGMLFSFTTMDKFDFASALAGGFLLTGAAFGADMVQDGEGDLTSSFGQYPLLATVLALGVAIYLFRRSTAGYSKITDALIDAVRAALMLGVMTFILSIVMKIWEPDLDGFDSSGSDSGLDFLGAPVGMSDGKTTMSMAGALFLPILLLLVLLVFACFVRRDWMGDKLAKVHDFVAAPLWGLATLVAVTLPAGLLYMIAIIAGEKDARGFAPVMGLLGNLPGIGLHMIGLGSLSKLGFFASSSNDDAEEYYSDLIKDDGGESAWIADFAGDHGALFWIALLVGIPALAAAVWMVVKKCTPTANPLINVGVYVASLLLFVPLMVRLANVHVVQSDDDDSISIAGGLAGGNTLLLFLAFSLVAGAVILVLTKNLDVNALKAKAQSFQGQPGQAGQPGQQPGQWGQQPQQGQWGQQPGTGPQQPQGGQQWGQPGQGTGPQDPQGGQQWGQPQPPQQGQQPPYGQQPPQQGGWQPPSQ
ncbi:hypothetical protein ASG90_06600 [Nocardioides sp. Soil797]|nr:hypothetical protein ASG90_06600 [Nocardioides sp. Soil797]